MALLQAPPVSANTVTGEEPELEWIRKQFRLVMGPVQKYLEECIKEFNGLCMNVQRSDWNSTMEMLISKDLIMMQVQPAIVSAFRRFVVIKASDENHAMFEDGVSATFFHVSCSLNGR